MVPAHEGLDRLHPARSQLDDGLVVGDPLGRGGGVAQLPLDRPPAAGLAVHLGVEDLDAVLAGRLGLVHGHVGVAQER